MQNILITGGTGMVGKSITNLLITKGYGVHIFTRNTTDKPQTNTLKYFEWNTDNQTFDINALQNVIAIINLAGEGVGDKRWTNERKKMIQNSRTNSGQLITKILLENNHTVQTLIQASATGWYKPFNYIYNEHNLQEDAAANNDFLGLTCKAWEDSILAIKKSNIRVVTVRIGIVLNQLGGMVKEMKLPMQFGILPIFGNGKQLVPWIHQNDLNGIILYCIENEHTNGIYNAAASSNTTQKELAKQIAKALNKKWWIAFAIPSFVLKIALGEFSIELLKSIAIYNDNIKKAGYTFEYPALENMDKL